MSTSDVLLLADDKAVVTGRWQLLLETCRGRRNSYSAQRALDGDGYVVHVFGGPPVRDMTYQHTLRFAGISAMSQKLRSSPLNTCREAVLDIIPYHISMTLDDHGRVLRVFPPRTQD